MSDNPTKTIFGNGTIIYQDENGLNHRIDGPARVDKNGSEQWYWHGELHRDDGPALIWKDNKGNLVSEAWFFYGKEHRFDGPSSINYANGTRTWKQYGVFHREDGMSIEYKNGKGFYHWHGEQLCDEEEYISRGGKVGKSSSVKQNDLHGKVMEIDGVKYRLIRES